MRVLSCLMVLAVFGSGSAAMAQEVSWGIKGGVNFAKLHVEDEPDDSPMKTRVGIVAGAFFTIPLGGLFSVQPEVLYSQKGAKFEVPGLIEGATELDYLEVPVLVRVGQWNAGGTTFNAFAGPSFGFRARARATGEASGESESEDISDSVEPFDLGVVFGAGVEIGRFTVDGRYTWGLSNINAEEFDNTKITNRVFSVLAGVRF